MRDLHDATNDFLEPGPAVVLQTADVDGPCQGQDHHPNQR